MLIIAVVTIQHVVLYATPNDQNHVASYEGWNVNSDNYLFTTDTK